MTIARPEHSGRIIINILGKTGSGKGTLGQILSKTLNLQHVSIGDLFRSSFEKKSIKEPNYGDDQRCINMLEQRLLNFDCAKGLILDGFPRTAIQADYFVKKLLKKDDVHIPILLRVSNEVVINRISKRYYCDSCKLQVREHEYSKIGDCPYCLGSLTKRIDDNTAVILKKLDHYDASIGSILEKLAVRDQIHVLDIKDNSSIDESFQEIMRIISQRLGLPFTDRSNLLTA